jgi:hypothetical protein
LEEREVAAPRRHAAGSRVPRDAQRQERPLEGAQPALGGQPLDEHAPRQQLSRRVGGPAGDGLCPARAHKEARREIEVVDTGQHGMQHLGGQRSDRASSIGLGKRLGGGGTI